MAAPLHFWFEFASTYSYLTAMRIESMAEDHGVTLVWRPFLLGPIFVAQGWNDSPFNLYPAKGRYMWQDMARICAVRGLAFRQPSVFPRNGLRAARIACLNSGAAWLPAFVRAVYTANFAADQDIADAAVLADCLEAAGTAPAPALSASTTDAARAALREQTDTAMAMGLFGAPSFTVGEALFWGDDRLDMALQAALAAPG